MKRFGYIYEKVYDIDNIKTAMRKSSLGKRERKSVKKILDDEDKYAIRIRKMLMDKTYKHSNYDISVMKDGATQKERTIYKPKYYPDQIVHWALMLQLEPILLKGMYMYSCGSVKNRGASLGQKMLRKWLDEDKRNTKYCLKMDVKKFYPSIDNEMLKQTFRRKIKDLDCLWLIDEIIDSTTGLPIGNYTSQWFANYFLTELDHMIKQKLNVKYYIRYIDDLVLLGPNKKKLHKARVEIESHLNVIGLELKSNWQVFRVDKRDIDFLGYRFYRDKTILRKRNALRIKRRMKKINQKQYLNYNDACAVVSYWGWIKRCDSYNFYNKNVKTLISIKKARKVVSYHAKVRSCSRW